MVEAQTSEKSDGLETVLVGYQMAISLWIHHSEQVWARFNIMFVGHSIVIAAIGLLTTSQTPSPLLATFLSVLGLFLCVLWFFLIRRGNEYAKYYTLSARELEERYLSPHVRTVSRGGLFADGESVNFEIPGIMPLRMSGEARLEARPATYATSLAFAAFYLIAIAAQFHL
jgi:uncharacterized membrane protein YjgN (DUF898 family)